jgi:hypothetical protein
MKRKHPNGNDADPSILLDGPITFVDSVMFQNLTESTIMKSALRFEIEVKVENGRSYTYLEVTQLHVA